jgi:hypothetical protein
VGEQHTDTRSLIVIKEQKHSGLFGCFIASSIIMTPQENDKGSNK